MTTPAASLARLVEVAAGDLTGQTATEALSEALEDVLQLKAASGWSSLEGEEVSAVALTRALGDILNDKEAGLQGHAAAVYAALLSVQDAPIGTLCEPYAFSAFIHCLRSICLPSKREAVGEGGTQQADGAGDQMAGPSPLALLEDVGTFLKHHSLRGSPEMFQLLLETLVDFTSSVAASGKPEKGVKRGSAAARNQGVSVAEAAFALLPLAMDTRHASVTQIAAVVCHRLTPAFVGLDAAKRSSHGWDRRTASLNLMNNFFRAHEAARPCRTALMRRLCLKAPDKADCRQMALNSSLSLLPDCTPAEVRAFCLFLYRLSRTNKIANRMMAVDLAGALLSSISAPFTRNGPYQRLVDGSCGPGEQLEAPWSALCLAVVVSRANDKSASVRSKAIGCLADCAQSFAKRLMDAPEGGQAASDIAAFLPALCASRHIQVQVTLPRGAAAEGADGDERDDDDDDGDPSPAANTDPDVAAAPPREAKVTATIPGKVSLDLSWMRSMCHARCRDEKAAVRKVALLLLESVLELCVVAARGVGPSTAARPSADGPIAEDLHVLEEATADSLVSVRKAALQVLCSLVEYHPHHAELACVWARSVLPLIRDPESSVQEAVLDKISGLLLEPLMVLGKGVARGRGRGGAAAGVATAMQQQVAAEVRLRLAALAQIGRAASSCLGKALGMMSAKKLLKGPQVAAGLEAFLSADREGEHAVDGGAGIRDAPSMQRGPQDAELERERTRQQRRAVRDQQEGAWMLLVEVAGQDPAAPSWQFLQRCWAKLQRGGGGADAGADAASQEGAMLLWVISHAASRFPAEDAANLASGLLEAILGFNLPCAAVAAHLAALHKLTQAEGGHAVVGAPATWCARVQEACEDVLAKAMDARGNLSGALATHCQLALFTFGEVALLRETPPPSGAAVKVQALTYNRGASQGVSAAARVAQTTVSAHAWTCLGKMCMVDESLAKKCVPLLVQEMSGSPSPVVRTNLLVGLADMVVQFTGLADAYVGRLADMVRDPHELVRRQALALLANLLLRDYVKWRGVLVHRFLLALVDESPSVRQLAQYLLSDSLASKAPLLAYNHFLESLFVLNACSAGLRASRSSGGASAELASELAFHSGHDGSAFHLKGSDPIMRAKRDIIYTALLRRMSPEHRFSAFARLTAEVLGGVVDGALPLEEAGEVLGDALRLLVCKDMKVNANRFGAAAEDDAEQLTGTQEDAAKARGRLVGAMMRKHLTESVVPLMVELRYMLQAQKHPLLGSLMLCMASLLREHKSEIEEILVSDKQLALEIMHDLKHYESLAKQHQQQQEAAMAAALAPKLPPTGPSTARAASTHTQLLGAAGAAAPATTAQGAILPPTGPADKQSCRTSVLPGVEPSRTPIAAEVLATASKLRRNAQELTAQHTPFPPAGPSAAAVTPAAGLQGAAGAAAAMRTPPTGMPGTAQRVILPGGMNVMLSPAPLSIRAKKQQRTPGAATALQVPRAAIGADRGISQVAGSFAANSDPAERITVVLPSPLPSAQQVQAHRPPLGSHNLSASAGSSAAAVHPPGEKPSLPTQRTPPAMLAAAVQAARQAAAAAFSNDENGEASDGSPAGGDRMDVDTKVRVVGAEAVHVAGREQRDGKRAMRASVKVTQDITAEAVDGVGSRRGNGVVARRGAKSRSGKRRNGAGGDD
ncbi:hypothetical protein Vretifemale_9598 [Volvox reticuliferus]|uniref:Condensin complex subunit 1 C-terminal domain-containing protein n=1 Tax=Volvox reticuliferus TaxID=1737510 RepID=A0A8J4CEQ3_9CHLO|nr:hypothetical protein Vretifemale_9598 [Volvox reticuliferus]